MASKKETTIEAEVKENKVVEMTPSGYFEYTKNKIQDMPDGKLKDIYNNSLEMLKRFMVTKQAKAAKKLMMYIESIEKEIKIYDAGFTKYVLRDDVEVYMDKIASKVVKIVSLDEYERVIPDDIIDKIASLPEGLFDKMYIVFTDYTGKEEKKVSKERRDKDPILFGSLLIDGYVADRMYYIADWVDEFCDLTLDKLAEEYKAAKDSDIVKDITFPETTEELKSIVDSMKG